MKRRITERTLSIPEWQIYKYEHKVKFEKFIGIDDNGLHMFKWHNKIFHIGKEVKH